MDEFKIANAILHLINQLSLKCRRYIKENIGIYEEEQ